VNRYSLVPRSNRARRLTIRDLAIAVFAGVLAGLAPAVAVPEAQLLRNTTHTTRDILVQPLVEQEANSCFANLLSARCADTGCFDERRSLCRLIRKRRHALFLNVPISGISRTKPRIL
jgi:hypothetical protein